MNDYEDCLHYYVDDENKCIDCLTALGPFEDEIEVSSILLLPSSARIP